MTLYFFSIVAHSGTDHQAAAGTGNAEAAQSAADGGSQVNFMGQGIQNVADTDLVNGRGDAHGVEHRLDPGLLTGVGQSRKGPGGLLEEPQRPARRHGSGRRPRNLRSRTRS